jgi:hypothetical protein
LKEAKHLPSNAVFQKGRFSYSAFILFGFKLSLQMDPNSSIQIYRVADLGHVAMFRWNWRKQEQKAIKLKERKKRTDR